MMTIDAALAARLDAARTAVEAAQDAIGGLLKDLRGPMYPAVVGNKHTDELYAALREAHRIVDALADEAEAAAGPSGGEA